jgi:arginine/lysine/ornithine decarboxylase
MAAYLLEAGIVSEFHDPDALVLMPSPDLTQVDLSRLTDALLRLPKRKALLSPPPVFSLPKAVMSPREALCSIEEKIAVEQAEGRVLSTIGVSCPPAVPIVVSGERIDRSAIDAFAYYGISHCLVVKE